MSMRRKAGEGRRQKGVGAEIRAEAWTVRIGPQQNMLRTVAGVNGDGSGERDR